MYLGEYEVTPEDRIQGIPEHATLTLEIPGRLRAQLPPEIPEAGEEAETEEAKTEDPNSWASRLRKRSAG